MCGSIKDEILDMDRIVLESIQYLALHYPKLLMDRYPIKITDPEDILLQIGKARGFLLKGGAIDIERTNRMFMNELRGMKIGAMSYERPEVESI